MKQESFEFFWESNSPFSNWYKSDFILNGIKFNCVEQAMMYGKALCFNDNDTANKILKEASPREQKKLGRKVKNFNSSVWDSKCKQVVYDACRAKFTQNFPLLKEILSKKGKILVEASPYDKIWGIGLLATDPRALNRDTWLGKNYLGDVLTQLCEDLSKLTGNILTEEIQKIAMETSNQTSNVETKHSPQKPNISFEEFQKLDIRICEIIAVEKVPNTDKLYKMEIDTGLDKRTVVSAIAHVFKEEILLGQYLPFVLNLEPRKIKGIESSAMIILGESINSKKLFQIYPILWESMSAENHNIELIGATVI